MRRRPDCNRESFTDCQVTPRDRRKVWGLAIVPLTVTLTSICNALSRILWGSVSDRLGRENTMFLTFGIEAILVFLVTKVGGHPIAFVVLFALVFLFWGEVFSLF